MPRSSNVEKFGRSVVEGLKENIKGTIDASTTPSGLAKTAGVMAALYFIPGLGQALLVATALYVGYKTIKAGMELASGKPYQAGLDFGDAAGTAIQVIVAERIAKGSSKPKVPAEEPPGGIGGGGGNNKPPVSHEEYSKLPDVHEYQPANPKADIRTLPPMRTKVNAYMGRINCVFTAITTDMRMGGIEGTAMSDAYATGPAKSMAEVEEIMAEAYPDVTGLSYSSTKSLILAIGREGEGSRGIIFGMNENGSAGHAFNFSLKNGMLVFLDSQTGKTYSPSQIGTAFKSFKLFVTGKGQ